MSATDTPPVERFSYSIQEVADLTGLSYESVRLAIKNNELVARFRGSKAVIEPDAVRAFIRNLPDQRPKTAK